MPIKKNKSCLAPQYKSAVKDDFSKSYTAYMRKKRIKTRLSKLEANKVINRFLEILGEQISESRSGVLVKRIGYFCVYRHPFIFPPRNWAHLKNYRAIHINNERCIFKYYMMDYYFNRKIQENIEKKVRDGQRYLNLMMGITTKDDMYKGSVASSIKKRKLYEKTIK